MTQYYFETLPLHPQPEPLESLTSYLVRLAAANSICSIADLAAVCFPDQHSARIRNLKDYSCPSLGKISVISACSEDVLQSMTFSHLLRKFGRSASSVYSPTFLYASIARYLRYCPMCLAESCYYSLPWRFSSVYGCYKHSCRLLEECGHCVSLYQFSHPCCKLVFVQVAKEISERVIL